MNNKLISFPNMGTYHIPVKYLLSHIFAYKVMTPPKITDKTLEIGCKYSPEFVCMPFKYTLGTLIESLERGANIVIQAGGGCRYGYYSELQEQIIKDLGYQCEFINLVTAGKTDLKQIYRRLKELDPSFKAVKGLYYLFITSKMIKYMDKLDHYIRANIGFEVEKGSFEKTKKAMLTEFSKTKNYRSLYLKYLKYKYLFKKIKIAKPKKCLKVGLIGELYTIMEPTANYELEKMLASYHIEIKRFTDVHYLLIKKRRAVKRYLRYAKEYIKYPLGSDAADNIGRTKYLCEYNYDGIIHLKSSFCTPEITIMPLINKICQEYNMPVLYFSFDAAREDTGIKTRIEAFYDMIEMRKNK